VYSIYISYLFSSSNKILGARIQETIFIRIGENFHNSTPFILFYIFFYLRKIERCVYLIAVLRTAREESLMNVTKSFGFNLKILY